MTRVRYNRRAESTPPLRVERCLREPVITLGHPASRPKRTQLSSAFPYPITTRQLAITAPLSDPKISRRWSGDRDEKRNEPAPREPERKLKDPAWFQKFDGLKPVDLDHS